MTYDEWTYLYPPRPESAITSDVIRMYESRGWVGQYKKNGTCAVVGVGPDRSFKWMNRHPEELKWEPPESIVDLLWDMFGSDKWTVLVAELVHSKVKAIRNKLYIFDYLVWDGEYVLDTAFVHREETLLVRAEPFIQAEARGHWLASKDLWIAKINFKNLERVFHNTNSPEDEGLVLKNPLGKLRDCSRPNTNGHWQVKVRHPKTNYAF